MSLTVVFALAGTFQWPANLQQPGLIWEYVRRAIFAHCSAHSNRENEKNVQFCYLLLQRYLARNFSQVLIYLF